MKKEIIILGAGESGVGAALLAKSKGQSVFVSDTGEIHEKYRKELIDNKIDFEESGHDFDRLSKASLAIVSPGIPDKAKSIRVLRDASVPMISEIEYGYRHTDAYIVAITGSNGKTTTTGLVYHMMLNAGLDVAVGGNYGISMCRVLADSEPQYLVLELSSFQLERMVDFKADIAILLNITADHLDRYDYSISLYAAAKCNIVNNQTNKDLVIYNGDDHYIQKYLEPRLLPSTRSIRLSTKDYSNGLVSKDDEVNFLTTLNGIHNLFNASCAIAACREVGLTESQIARGLSTFANMPHRMELIAEIDGVQYINDSKATNVDAVYYALDAMNDAVIWIAGGVDKGNDYSQITDLVRTKVKAIICLTKYPEPILKAFGSIIEQIEVYEDTEVAVRRAAEWSEDGDQVLFSPACASFDLYENYMDRGNKFKESVKLYYEI